MSASLSQLPQQEKDRLERLSISDLITVIEGADFECEGGPLSNFIEWMELKARCAGTIR